jgi:ABC-type proline/glycine betaine transport system permease subunit
MASSSINWKDVATDITKFGGLGVIILEAVENAVPGLGVSGGAQVVIAAIVSVLTALLSISKSEAVNTAKTGKA